MKKSLTFKRHERLTASKLNGLATAATTGRMRSGGVRADDGVTPLGVGANTAQRVPRLWRATDDAEWVADDEVWKVTVQRVKTDGTLNEDSEQRLKAVGASGSYTPVLRGDEGFLVGSNELDRVFYPWVPQRNAFPWGSLWNFGISLKDGDALTVHYGEMDMHWISVVVSYEQYVTLTGDTCYVYAHRPAYGNTIVIMTSPTRPESAGSDLRVLLYVFSRVETGIYKLERVCLHGLNFAPPLS